MARRVGSDSRDARDGTLSDSPFLQLPLLRLPSCSARPWATGPPNSHWFLFGSTCPTINKAYWRRVLGEGVLINHREGEARDTGRGQSQRSHRVGGPALSDPRNTPAAGLCPEITLRVSEHHKLSHPPSSHAGTTLSLLAVSTLTLSLEIQPHTCLCC